jgi:uncharacterized protein YcbK (DUF882 family)
MESIFFEHYSKVPKDLWRWPNFTPEEISSRGNGSILINFRGLDTLQRGRTLAKKPFVIHSAYRDPLHNAMVGGAPRSYHLEGIAYDIGLEGFQRKELEHFLRQAGFTGFGLRYSSFIHADLGRRREFQ